MTMLREEGDASVVEAARKVRLLLMDCDGVLTDGRLYFGSAGEVMKVFHVRDGQGIARWHSAGFESGIVTGRGAKEVLEQRARELRIKHLRCDVVDKGGEVSNLIAETGVTPEEVAFIGDDLGDMPALRVVGFPAVVSDAESDVARLAIWRSSRRGGFGAVRELVDFILAAKER